MKKYILTLIKVIQKAKDVCFNAGEEIDNHFPDVRKMVGIGSKTERPIDDILLVRYACYLIAQNLNRNTNEQIKNGQPLFYKCNVSSCSFCP